MIQTKHVTAITQVLGGFCLFGPGLLCRESGSGSVRLTIWVITCVCFLVSQAVWRLPTLMGKRDFARNPPAPRLVVPAFGGW